MTTVKYFDGENVIEVEVTEKFAAQYKEMYREEDRIDKKEKRLKALSLEQLAEDGREIEELLTNPLDAMIEREERSKLSEGLKAALVTLTPEQQELVRLLKSGNSMRETARMLNKNFRAVWNMRERIQKKFKEFL